MQQVSQGQHSSVEPGPGLAFQPLEYGVDPKAQDENQMTSEYHLQSNLDPFHISVLLLYYGANRNIRKNRGEAPLYQEIAGDCYIQGGVGFTASNVSFMY